MSKDEYLITDTPLKALTVFAMPMILGSFFQQIYNMADSIIVGQFVGSSALAKTVNALRGVSVIKYSSFDIIIFLHGILYRGIPFTYPLKFRVVELFLLSILSDIAYRFHSFIAQNLHHTA